MGEYTEYILNLNKLLAGYLVKEEIEPKVSVVVPAYNVEKYIERCLVSLIKQTLREIEIIVVDDGSTDFTSGIINAFAKIDKRIKVIMQENLKQGSARNNGMKIAKGEYIGFVDSDDWVDFAYFEKMYNAVKKYGSDIALSTNVRVGNGVTKKRLNLKTEKVYTQLQDKFDVSNIIKNQTLYLIF